MAIAGAPVETRMMMGGEPVSAQAMEAMNVSISAQNVSVSGANVGSGGDTPVTVVVQPQDVVLDNQKGWAGCRQHHRATGCKSQKPVGEE